MASNVAFKTFLEVKKSFILDRKLSSKFERARNAALRRFGTIVQRDAKKSLKPARPSDYVVRFEPTGRLLYGASANSAMKAKSGRLVRKRGGPPVLHSGVKTNPLRKILFGSEESGLDTTVVIGPIAFASSRPTVPEKLEHKHFPFMRPALDRKRHELLLSLLKFEVV